eukprot:m.602053 g.602053  ORF g.602053 m.602053 type:complete len:346 (+) comp58092_c0_seq3:180-1217(+)
MEAAPQTQTTQAGDTQATEIVWDRQLVELTAVPPVPTLLRLRKSIDGDGDLRKLLSKVLRCTRVTTIDLTECKLTDSSLEQVQSLLTSFPQLHTLKCHANKFSPASYQQLLPTLMSHKRIEFFSLTKQVNQLPELHTNHFMVTQATATHPSDLASVQYITLSGGAAPPAVKLGGEAHLRSFSPSIALCSNLSLLCLRGGKLHDVTCLRSLRACTAIRTFILSDNKVDNLDAVVDGLANCTALESFHCERNQLTDECWSAVSRLIGNTRSLQSLLLAKNKFTRRVYALLANALLDTPQALELHIIEDYYNERTALERKFLGVLSTPFISLCRFLSSFGSVCLVSIF